tara:strand:+ start:17420 stop:18469 length:1050 start_codon:yes stop_codon:yes gene_type:complete
MRILLIADPHIPIPPNQYGGTERMVDLYGQEFTRLGHRVDLIAAKGSKGFGSKLYIHKSPSKSIISRAFRKIWFQIISLFAASKCDVIYNFGRFDYLESLLLIKKPILHFFANQIDQSQINFAEKRIISNVAFHCISQNQKTHAVIKTKSFIIPNIVSTNNYIKGSGKDQYLVFLGRLTYNKGVDIAIKAAIKSNKKLIIAGNISKEEGGEDYFYKTLVPLLNKQKIEWIGPVNDSQKQELLANAEALLFPIRWDEPFGIVMVESLACGTPVIATRRASTPEVIKDGITGYLCEPNQNLVDSFVDAIGKVKEINRQSCRNHAEENFDIKVVSPKVISILHQLINKDKIY